MTVLSQNTSCLDCVHFNRDKWGTCKAYPKGIPNEITFGLVEHTIPYKGDHGKQFELLPFPNLLENASPASGILPMDEVENSV